MAKTKFHSRYNPKPLEKGTDFTGQPEVCNQLSADECEIKKLLYSYEAGDINSLPVVRDSVYNDIAINPQSYEQAKALIDKVNADFMSLPKETQRQFGNINTYVSDISKISLGDPVTIQKYANFRLSESQETATTLVAEGNSSSSLSRGDSEKSLDSGNSAPVNGFAESEVKNNGSN